MLTNVSYIKELLERHGFHFSKKLGQNFLINPSVCPRIAEYGFAQKGFGILEIGTGIGTLTRELALRADKVVAIELDERLFPILDETLGDFDNINIIHADVMSYPLENLIKNEFVGMNVALCANLPYYITSPILMKLLELHLPLKGITVMVQREAAQRLCATVGTRESGAITVAVAYYGKAKQLFPVARGSFLPAPNVDSAVIQIQPYEESPWEAHDEKLFFRIVKAGFSKRRKMLLGVLAEEFHYKREELQLIYDKAGIAYTVRIETLTIPEIITLCNVIGDTMFATIS